MSDHVSLHPTKTREKTVLVESAAFPKIIADLWWPLVSNIDYTSRYISQKAVL